MLKIKLNPRKLKGFAAKYKISGIIVSVSIILAFGALIYFLSQNDTYNAPALKLIQKPKETGVSAPLTGLLVDQTHASRRAFAAVIENYPDARPQSGYNEADIVYETLAEGGITRTLAIFQSKDSKEIGPIRSARLYFIDWASEANAIFSHVGGNADALDEILKIKYPDLNQFYYGNYYWRSSDRYAPHNVYTTTDKLIAAAKSAGLDVLTSPPPLKFKDDVDTKTRPASQKINISFSSPDYAVGYTYDPKDNSYFRDIAGVANKDKATGIQVKPKNIVVQFTTEVPFVNYVGEQGVKIETTGSGSGYVFLDGKAIKATWSKDSRTAKTKFFDSESKEILLNKGQTWFEVVPIGQSVTY